MNKLAALVALFAYVQSSEHGWNDPYNNLNGPDNIVIFGKDN